MAAGDRRVARSSAFDCASVASGEPSALTGAALRCLFVTSSFLHLLFGNVSAPQTANLTAFIAAICHGWSVRSNSGIVLQALPKNNQAFWAMEQALSLDVNHILQARQRSGYRVFDSQSVSTRSL